MPALADPTTWRTHPQWHKGYLFVLKPTVVFAARVNQDTFNYPLSWINYDGVTTGDYTDIQPGMTVLFGSTAGADDLGRQRIRKAATGTTLYIGWSSQGDHDGEVAPTDDAYITVLNDYRVWAKTPYITDTGVTFKDFDIAVGSYHTTTVPVANGGPGYAGFVDPVSDVITVSFDGSGSFSPSGGALTYAWDFVDGTPATANTATVSDVTFPPGFRWVSLTVTANGLSHTCRIPVYAAKYDGTNDPIDDFEVLEHVLRPEGQTISFRVHSGLSRADYPDGTLVMYWEEEYYDTTQGSLAGFTGREHMKFIGWHQDDPAKVAAEREGVLSEVTLNCVDVAGRLASLPGWPQIVEASASPSVWEEMTSPNVDKYLHYLLQWHSTALDLADFTWSGTTTTYPFVALASDGMSLYDQVNQRAEAIAHRFTCDRQGRLFVKPDPMLQAVGSRTSTVIVDIDETDWEEMTYTWQRPPRVHWLRGAAIVASASAISAVFCVAPGSAPGQGEQSQDQNYQLVVNQAELNTREGHRYARLNATQNTFSVVLGHGNDAGIDPAYMEWVRLTLSATYAAERGYAFTDARFLPLEVSIAHNHKDGTKTVTLTLEKEVIGYAAETYIPPEGDLPDYTPPSFYYVEPSPVSTWGIAGVVNNMAALATNGIYVTSGFQGNPPTWTTKTLWTTLSVAGYPLDFCPYAFSPGYISGSGYINGWLVTSSGIYYIEDIFGTPAATLQHTFPYTTFTWPYVLARTIDASFGVDGHVVVASSYAYEAGASYRGTWLAYTTDGGATWTEYRVTAFNKLRDAYIGLRPGVYVSSKTAGLVYMGAFSAGNNTHKPTGALYRSTAYGASMAEVSSPANDLANGIGNGMHFPWNNNDDEDIYYAMRYSPNTDGGPNPETLRVFRADGSLTALINPIETVGTYTYHFGPICSRWGISTSPQNRSRIAMAATGFRAYPGGDPRYRVYVSVNGGASWTGITTLTNNDQAAFARVAISGDNQDILYLWGSARFQAGGPASGPPLLQYSTDFGTTLVDKVGNLAALGAKELLAICGGPS